MLEEFLKNPNEKLLLISGPCVIENFQNTRVIASFLKQLTDSLGIHFIFKASYDKANRSSIHSFRGHGIVRGLEILSAVKEELGIEITSDVHQIQQVEYAAEILDLIQIPALLSRQTDLVVEAARTKKPVNIKKGQFAAPEDMANIIEKARSEGNNKIMITERGTTFGYHNLVVDMRSIPIIQESCPVVFDATHSVQLPGSLGTCSGGSRDMAPVLASAAVAAGAQGIFMETHFDPDAALCDGPNSIELRKLEPLIKRLIKIKESKWDGQQRMK